MVLALGLWFAPSGLAQPADGSLGRPATQAEIAARDIDVRPDGAGLPPGRGGVARGEEVFAEKCAVCHGEFAEGVGRMPALMGGEESLKTDRPRRTVGSYWPFATTLFDYIRRAMPFGHARGLSADEIYALSAFILNANGIVDDDFIADSASLPKVKMPNRDGFLADDRPAHPNTRCMKNCRPAPRIISRAADNTAGDTGKETE